MTEPGMMKRDGIVVVDGGGKRRRGEVHLDKISWVFIYLTRLGGKGRPGKGHEAVVVGLEIEIHTVTC